MKVNGLELPRTLQVALLNGVWMSRGKDYSGRWRDKHHLALFKALCPRIENPLPQFLNYDGMLRENTLWCSSHNVMKFFIGASSIGYPPGNVDPQLTVIIGESEPDSPIALDYRTSVPRIVYFCDIQYETLWVEAAKDIETFMSALEL